MEANINIQKPALTFVVRGAGIALILVTLMLLYFLLITGEWVSLPIFIVPLAGAFGGLFYYLMVAVWFKLGWQKKLAIIMAILIYVVMLWVSLVFALDITGHWD